MLCEFLVCFEEWYCESKAQSWGSVYPYVGSGVELLQPWMRYWDDISVLTSQPGRQALLFQDVARENGSLIFHRCQCWWAPEVILDPQCWYWYSSSIHRLLFLKQLLIYTSTTSISRLPRSPAPSLVLCSFMCCSTCSTYCFFFLRDCFRLQWVKHSVFSPLLWLSQ